MKPRFLGNLGTRKLHSIDFADGRCKINQIKEENKMLFLTLEEGMAYPDVENRVFAPCGVCIRKYRQSKETGKGRIR